MGRFGPPEGAWFGGDRDPDCSSGVQRAGVSKARGLDPGIAGGVPVDTPRPSARLGELKVPCFRDVLSFSAPSPRAGAQVSGGTKSMPCHQLPNLPLNGAGLQLNALSFHGIRNAPGLPVLREWGPGTPPAEPVGHLRHGTCFLVQAEDASPKGGAENEETAA